MIVQEQCGAAVTITLNRPNRRNALDIEACDQLASALRGLDCQVTRAAVITGSGSAFCAGADLGQVYGAEFRASLYAMLGAITSSSIPVIAAVNGPAIGAGTQLALACDIRVASDDAVFAVPTARNGLAIDAWSIRRMAFLSGAAASYMLLTGRSLSAARAYVLGLVDECGDLDRAERLAQEIASLAPLSLSYSKRALASCSQSTDTAGEDELHEGFLSCWNSHDVIEGRAAAKDHRPARFEGR